MICAALVLVIAVVSFAACNTQQNDEQTTGTETGTAPSHDFDFSNADVSQYISLDPSAYQNMNITVSNAYEVNDTNVKSYIDSLLKEYAQPLKVTDQAVKNGDTVYIYYQGLLDGVAFEGGTYAETETSEPYALTIGSGKFIDGFEEGLIGVIPEETSKDTPVSLNLKFPDNYSNSPDLAGRSVVFNVYIKYLSNETYVPEYTAETVTDILDFKATGDDVIGEFEAHIKTLLQEEQNSAVLSEIMKTLQEKVTVKSYPQESIDYWYGYYVDQIQQYVDYYTAFGMQVTFDEMARNLLGIESTADWKAELISLAQDNAKSRMIYYAIAQQNNIKVTDDDYEDTVQYVVEYYKDNGYSYTKEEIINGIGEDAIRESAMFQKADELLLSNCTVSFKASSSN